MRELLTLALFGVGLFVATYNWLLVISNSYNAYKGIKSRASMVLLVAQIFIALSWLIQEAGQPAWLTNGKFLLAAFADISLLMLCVFPIRLFFERKMR